MMLVCSAKIKTGSQNVFIGGPTARTEFVWDITSWLETGFTWLGYAALAGAAVFAAMAGIAVFAGFEGWGRLGDMIGPGCRDLFQGIAGMGLLLASPKMVGRSPTERGVLGPNKGSGYAAEVKPGGSGQAIAGHGEYRYGSGNTNVPEGTTVLAPRDGIKISDRTGRFLENVNPSEYIRANETGRRQMIDSWLDSEGINSPAQRARVHQDMENPQIVQSGESIPNYTIKTPDGITVHENSTTVENSTPLGDILKPNSGCVALGTCTK
jgi:hypothetical protein